MFVLGPRMYGNFRIYMCGTGYKGTEAEIQLPLRGPPDSSVSSLILVGWCEEGYPATKNSLQLS